jgi:DNA-binding NarL/FixJ family response regulator
VAKYLIVDDSPTVRLTLAASIRNARKGSVELAEASDAEGALREFRARAPDVVFLDMMLPKGSGLEVLRTMLEESPTSRIVLVTGLPPGDPQVVQGIAAGAFALLQKPARTEAIRKVLNDIDAEAGRFGRIR